MLIVCSKLLPLDEAFVVIRYAKITRTRSCIKVTFFCRCLVRIVLLQDHCTSLKKWNICCSFTAVFSNQVLWIFLWYAAVNSHWSLSGQCGQWSVWSVVICCRLWILQVGGQVQNDRQCWVHDKRQFKSRLRQVYGNFGDEVQVEGLRQVTMFTVCTVYRWSV